MNIVNRAKDKKEIRIGVWNVYTREQQQWNKQKEEWKWKVELDCNEWRRCWHIATTTIAISCQIYDKKRKKKRCKLEECAKYTCVYVKYFRNLCILWIPMCMTEYIFYLKEFQEFFPCHGDSFQRDY